MFEIKIITTSISLFDLQCLAENQFGSLVKAVVDIEKKIMAIGGELHADEESFMIRNGSKQENLWGINIYPEMTKEDRIEFDSMINIRPYMGNRSWDVKDPAIRQRILDITCQLITE